jgi:hypothetical protein
MAGESIDEWAAKILSRLAQAGSAGTTKSALGIRGGSGVAARAFEQLVSAGRVANIGSPGRPRWVRIEHFNPLELACGRIEQNALAATAVGGAAVRLLAKKALLKGCAGAAAQKAAEALERLVRDGRLVRLQAGGRIYYVHRDRLPLPSGSRGETEARTKAPAETAAPSAAPEAFDRQAVLAAYRRLRERTGYSHVEIALLRREAGCGMEALKAFIREESRQGRAVLGLGDWSLSSEETRAGAVELFGKPHLLVRLEAE